MKRRGAQWRELSFLDNLAAAADAVGFDNADIALGLARVDWQSVQDREEFLQALTGRSSREVIEEGVNAKLP
jgi:hypothetical protein